MKNQDKKTKKKKTKKMQTSICITQQQSDPFDTVNMLKEEKQKNNRKLSAIGNDNS